MTVKKAVKKALADIAIAIVTVVATSGGIDYVGTIVGVSAAVAITIAIVGILLTIRLAVGDELSRKSLTALYLEDNRR